MPGFDRTGPLGLGPRTGRGLGYCTGGPWPRYGWGGYGVGRGGRPWGGGRGRAWGGGRGFGWRMWGYPYPPAYPVAPYSAQDEKAWLNARLNDLRAEMESIQKRLDAIGKDSDE